MPKKHILQLSIPQPCTEDWDKMTPNEQGRHCQSCNKTVVDFSLFTDKQLIEFFEKVKGLVCGRASNNQLQRQLIYVEPQNHFLHKLLFGTAIAVGLAGSANAAYNPSQIPLVEQYGLNNNKEKEPLVGGGKDTIRIKVVDSANTEQSLPFVSVVILRDSISVGGGTTDFSGMLLLTGLRNYNLDELTLKVVYNGYHDYITKKISTDMQIGLSNKGMELKEVAISHPTGVIDCKAYPQNPGCLVPVNVKDYRNSKPLSNASIQLFWNDVLQSSAKTDSIGNAGVYYERDLNGRELILHIAADGYKSFDEKITADKEDKNPPVVSVKLVIAKK